MKTLAPHALSTPRFLIPIHIRSNRKVASHPKTSKLCSSKRLHSIVVLTSVTCAGSRHCQIKSGTCMAHKKFAHADSKTGSKIRSKNRSPHQGPRQSSISRCGCPVKAATAKAQALCQHFFLFPIEAPGTETVIEGWDDPLWWFPQSDAAFRL